MSASSDSHPEASTGAPTRHPLNWRDPDFYDESQALGEMERVFDICHGCRRCVSLCHAFPTLFDLVDESETLEIDGVDKADYWKVVEQCYLCDLCYMTKCPYVPPHPWQVDFPKLMLRGKAIQFRKGEHKRRDKILSATDTVGRLAGIPVVAQAVNKANSSAGVRKLLERTLGVHPDAWIPEYHSDTARKRLKGHHSDVANPQPVGRTRGRAALFATCFGNYNEPQVVEDLVKVFEHNQIAMTLVSKERCCGMPRLELGDLEAVDEAKRVNIPMLADMIDHGWDIVAPVPSCVLMFKQELPLMYPDDAEVAKVRDHIFDPFEYLVERYKEGKLSVDFKNPLGKVSYHVPCHLRVQNMGLKTRDLLRVIPDTEVDVIERCSGHDGTYAVKREYHDISMKIARPVVNRIRKAEPDHYSSDCPMAGHQIENGLGTGQAPEHPLSLLRQAYDI